jgi:hypothetical protein
MEKLVKDAERGNFLPIKQISKLFRLTNKKRKLERIRVRIVDKTS